MSTVEKTPGTAVPREAEDIVIDLTNAPLALKHNGLGRLAAGTVAADSDPELAVSLGLEFFI